MANQIHIDLIANTEQEYQYQVYHAVIPPKDEF